LKRLSTVNAKSANLICDYIFVEQSEINIKEWTKEGKIKVWRGYQTTWQTNLFVKWPSKIYLPI